MSDEKWDLSRLGAGERVALRRAAGSLEFNAAAWRAFYIACPNCKKRDEEFWFAAMCMECLWREEDKPDVRPMEECLQRYRKEDESVTDSMKHRMEVLLDMPWANDDFLLGKLYAVVRILKDKTNYKPDFHKLADDLRRWNYEDRAVQRRWLRTIFSDYVENNESEGGSPL